MFRIGASRNQQISFNDVPDEIALRIFRYLSVSQLFNPSLVCTRWNKLSKDNAIWKPIVLAHGWQGSEGQTWREVAIAQSQLFLRGEILARSPTSNFVPVKGLSSICCVMGAGIIGGFYEEGEKEGAHSKIAIWDIRTGEKLQVFDSTRDIPVSLCESYLTAAKKDSVTLFCRDGNKRVFPIAGGEVNHVASHPSFLAFAFKEKITIYDATTGNVIETLIDEEMVSRRYVDLKFFKDRLLCRDKKGKVRIFDYSTGKGRLITEFKIHKGLDCYSKEDKDLSQIRALDEKIMIEQKDSDFYVRELERGEIVYQFQITQKSWDRYGISAAISNNVIAITSIACFGDFPELYLANVQEKSFKKFPLPYNSARQHALGAVWMNESLYVVYKDSPGIEKVTFSN